ncbi:MAG: hypothetical protein IJ682_06970 [Lachnospiraceae bacterium]|nr:hypothetical protein [Lachnospiraceae bacterium]
MRRYTKRKMVSVTAAAFCLFMAGYSLFCGMHMTVYAAELVSFGKCVVRTVKSEDAIAGIPAGYTVKDLSIKRNDKEWHSQYFKFMLPVDAWVYLGGCYGNNNHDGIQTHVRIYSDKAMTNLWGEYGWGYWEYDNGFSGTLKKGTYYCSVASKYANFDDFTGDVNIMAAKMLSGKAIKPSVKPAKNKKSATVTVKDMTKESEGYMEYVKGNVKKASSGKAWNKAKRISLSGGKCSFRVKKNGVYSIRMKDIYGNWYLKKIKAKGLKQ